MIFNIKKKILEHHLQFCISRTLLFPCLILIQILFLKKKKTVRKQKMDNENKENLTSEQEKELKRKKLEEKFEKNYTEFINKPILNMPCLRPTLLTSKFLFLRQLISFNYLISST